MPHDQADLRADLKLAQTKVENALISCRVAERAAFDATAALERIEASLSHRKQPYTEPDVRACPGEGRGTEQLFCRVAEAAQLLSISERSVWRLIDGGKLETVQRGRARLIRMSSLKALPNAT